jgi:hypothetical protein
MYKRIEKNKITSFSYIEDTGGRERKSSFSLFALKG